VRRALTAVVVTGLAGYAWILLNYVARQILMHAELARGRR
jgi:hypothetical protein